MKPLQVTYTLTKEDYLNALEYHKRAFRRTPGGRNAFWMGWAAAVGVGGLIAIFSRLTRGHWTEGVVLTIVLAVIIRWSALAASRSRALRGYLNSPVALTERTLTLEDQGLTNRTQGATTRVLWRDIAAIDDDRENIYFLSRHRTNLMHMMFSIPDRAFVTAEKKAFLADATRRWTAAKQTSPEVSAWPETQIEPLSRLTISYSLTLGELSWMQSRIQAGSDLETLVLSPLRATVVICLLTWLLSGSWVFAAIMFVLAPILARGAWKHAKSAPISRGKAAQFSEEYTLTLTPDGVQQQVHPTLTTVPWSFMTRIEEKNEVFVLWGENIPLYLVPAKAFGSAEEAQAFLKTARDYHKSAQDGTPAPPPTRSSAWPPPPGR